jgi:hemoglobin
MRVEIQMNGGDMKRVSLFLLMVLTMITQVVVAQETKDPKMSSLYERIGGSDAIGRIFDEVGGRMAADPELAKFFQGQSQEALMTQRQRAVEFLCHETGGPCSYSGRPLKKVHASLGITESQWKAFLKHLNATLDNQKVSKREKSEFLTVVMRFKSDVVAK